MGKKFAVYTDNWSVLQALGGLTQTNPVIRRLEEIMYWYPKVMFVVGKDNGHAYYLIRFPMWKDMVTKCEDLVEGGDKLEILV